MVHASTDEETLQRLREQHPGWRLWRPRRRDGEPSSWAATRRDESAGVDPTVMANTAEELRAALVEQLELVERSGRRPVTVGDPFAQKGV